VLPRLAILLVEDEILTQNNLNDALVEAGFDVVAADDGAQALAELEAHADNFRAVITDIRVGKGPTGWDVGKRARELDPNMPVLYMSGDSASDWASMGVPKSVMVAKPFAPAQIITAVSTLITEADLNRGG
jgi:DNA-binding NtrC family response regulator